MGVSINRLRSFCVRTLTYPFRLHQSQVTSEFVLIARIMALVILALEIRPYPIGIPYLSVFDLVSPQLWADWSPIVMLIGVILVLFTPFFRVGCLVVASILSGGALACRGCLSVAHTYMAIMFLLIGLSSLQSGNWLLRLQVLILYFGALLNKLTSAGWWNGEYFELLMFERFPNQFYENLAVLLLGGQFSTVQGILVMGLEVILLLCFLKPSWYLYGIVLGVWFHTSVVLILGNTFGPFWYAMLASYIAFVRLPKRVEIHFLPSRWIARVKRVFKVLECDHYYILSEKDVRGERRLSYLDTLGMGLAVLFTSAIPYYVILLPMTSKLGDGLARNVSGVVLWIVLLLILRVVWLSRIGTRLIPK